MSADSVPGPRCFGAVADQTAKPKDGSYQFPTLGTTEQEIDLEAVKGEYVKIQWIPATTAVLLYGFFHKDDSARNLDAATDSSNSPFAVLVATAPGRIPVVGSEQERVPLDRTILVIKASAASGGVCVVRPAESS